jgi:hypothetical protein
MITTESALRLERESSWHLPFTAPRNVATDWRNEPHVFASEELGWLGDEARRRLHRSAGRVETFDVLHDMQDDTPAFARLAAHPRLLRRACDLLGGAVEIESAFVHCGSLVRPGLPARTDIAIIIVPLGWRAEAPLGGISLGTRPVRQARYEWPFVAIYRRTQSASATQMDDDCLWPIASIVAG